MKKHCIVDELSCFIRHGIRRLLLRLVQLYQIILSPLLGGECRFYPTCSVFAAEAIENLPPSRAIGEVLRRLLKCHPFHSGGFHPVPRP